MSKRRSALRRKLAAAAALATAMAGVTTVMLPASPAAAASAGYVTMGDSLSSGEGTYGTYLSGSDTSANKCHRSPASYAAQYVQQNSVNSYQLTNVACSGAGVNEIIYFANPNTGGINDNNEVAQDLALTSSTKLVTLTIGINDLNLIGLATNCYMLADKNKEDACFNGIPADSSYLSNLSALPGNLDRAYQAIRSHAPNATVAVLAYPQIYPATYSGDCQTFPFSGFALVTSQNMLNTARGLVHTLNTKIAAEVAKFPGFIFVDQAENALAGHDVCAGTRWVNQINGLTVFNQTTPDDESLHPTTSGYQAIGAILARRLDAGHYSSGTVDQNITNAYKNDGGLGGFGYPADNGGTPYVHYWSTVGANAEDFSGGGYGPTVIVEGPRGTFFVNYGFRNAYIGGAWSKPCLAPTDNAYGYGGGTRQDFVGCYMTWTPSGGVVVHGPNPGTCTDYGGSLMTGPNACIGFSTTSTWFSGGGVGLLGQEIWTYANGTVKDSTANYTLHGLDVTHAYTLQAYIPNNHSDASHAHYHYCGTNQGCADGYVNQNNYTNAWASFGTVCTTDGNATIQLADDGGDVYPTQVGADAIRAVRTGLVC